MPADNRQSCNWQDLFTSSESSHKYAGKKFCKLHKTDKPLSRDNPRPFQKTSWLQHKTKTEGSLLFHTKWVYLSFTYLKCAQQRTLITLPFSPVMSLSACTETGQSITYCCLLSCKRCKRKQRNAVVFVLCVHTGCVQMNFSSVVLIERSKQLKDLLQISRRACFSSLLGGNADN